MAELEIHPSPPDETLDALLRKDEIRATVRDWAIDRLTDGLARRQPLEDSWQDLLRISDGLPDEEARDIPVEGFERIEVGVGAIAAESNYSRILSTLFGVEPPLVLRAVKEEFEDVADDLQKIVNWLGKNAMGLEFAATHAVLDLVQLGTGFIYTPWVQELRKTRVRSIRRESPVAIPVAIQDMLLPPGAFQDLQRTEWVGYGRWMYDSDLKRHEKLVGWTIGQAMPAADIDPIRWQRERLARNESDPLRDRYRIWDLYGALDIDGDGEDEELLITIDVGSRTLLHVETNPYDRRPFNMGTFQPRAYMAYGIGIPEMLRDYERAITDLVNDKRLSVRLLNTVIFGGPAALAPEGTVALWHGRYFAEHGGQQIHRIGLGDAIPSTFMLEQELLKLAEARSGSSEITNPSLGQMGNRTPGITALTFTERYNQRLTLPVKSVRELVAGSARQGLWRLQERVLAQDPAGYRLLEKILGAGRTDAVVAALASEDFDDGHEVQMLAASTLQSRDQERQNRLLLANMMQPYYKGIMDLVAQAEMAKRQGIPAIAAVADLIIKGLNAMVKDTLQTFDEVRNPDRLVVALEEIQNATRSLAGVPGGQPGGGGLLPGMAGGGGPAGGPGGAPDGNVGGGVETAPGVLPPA